jgi:two-component system response regulator LytT
MQKIRIGVVEDEVIIADSICAVLTDLGYDVAEPCRNYEEAINMLKDVRPDLVLLDINLGKGPDGIEVGNYLRLNNDIPFIFLSANSDAATVERAKLLNPNAYLVKPFQKNDLYAAIEIAFHNFSNVKPATPSALAGLKMPGSAMFIKDGHYFHKVNYSDILYLSADHVYVNVHTAQRKFLVRATMQDYLEKFDPEKFVRTHRSYAVNIDKVDKINMAYVIINGEEVPISKNYRDTLLSRLNIG